MFLLGAVQVCAALLYRGWWTLFAWSGLAFCVVGLAYFTSSPWLLGKRESGRIHRGVLLLLLPYFCAAWASWWVSRVSSRERPWDEITPGLFLGRWPALDGLPDRADLVVVDLTAEFPRASSIGPDRPYFCLPTLDTATPSVAAVAGVAERIAQSSSPTYVHCALGHGRSAALVAAILLRRGAVASVPEATALLRSVRPGVGLSRVQESVLEEVALRFRAHP